MKTQIRPAQKQDCPRILELIKELALFEKAPNEVVVSLLEFEKAGFGSNPLWWAFVAETEGRVIAFALYYIRYSTWKGSQMYLEDILVTADMRGRGVGKKLFERLMEEAKEKKFSGMVWQVLNWNKPAIEFYKKYGSQINEEWLTASLELI